MAEIAMEAGYGKGTLYWYWKSKEELYFSLIRQMHEEILRLVEEAARREGTALEKFDVDGRREVSSTTAIATTASFLEDAGRGTGDFSDEYVESLHGYVERTKAELEKITAQGIEEEALPPVDPYYLACILLGLVEGMEIQWLEDPDSFDLGRGMEISLRFLLASNKGMRG